MPAFLTTSIVGLMSQAIAAPLPSTPLPFQENWGANFQTSCDSQFSSQCPDGWSGVGQANAITSVKATTSLGTGRGLWIVPAAGAININGVERLFDVTGYAGDEVSFRNHLTVVDGKFAYADASLEFLDASYNPIKTYTYTLKVEAEHNWNISAIVPASAAHVRWTWGVNNPSSSSTRVTSMAGGCLMIPGDFPQATPPQGPPTGECAEECDTSCNLTCSEGEKLVNECIPIKFYPICATELICQCVDASGTSDLMDPAIYQTI